VFQTAIRTFNDRKKFVKRFRVCAGMVGVSFDPVTFFTPEEMTVT
jgi:hypothetical protein